MQAISSEKSNFWRVFNRSGSQYSRGEYLVSSRNGTPANQIPFLNYSSSEPNSAYEVLAKLDSIDPKFRPTHRTGFFGIFGKKIDSASNYAYLFRKWDSEVMRLRKIPEHSSPTAVAIITFESPESAILASQVVVSPRAFSLMVKTAVEPRDIYWPNLCGFTANNYSKLFRSVY